MQSFELVPNEQRKRKRVFARSLFPMDREIGFRDVKRPGERKGILHSISQSGLFIRSREIPQLGTNLTVHFLFGTERIRCDGTVIYTNASDDGLSTQGFGIKFTRMMTKDYEIIKQALDSFFQMM